MSETKVVSQDSITRLAGLLQRSYLSHLPQACSYVPMLIPNHNVLVISSVQYTLAIISSSFTKVGTMIVWFYQI